MWRGKDDVILFLGFAVNAIAGRAVIRVYGGFVQE
jgi:hypothetical protein